MDLIWRALTPDDAADITALSNLVAATDDTGEVTTEQATIESFGHPRFNAETDTIGIWSGATLIGTGSVSYREELVEGRVLMGVHGHTHPDYRGQGLGARLLTWLENRAVDIAREQFPGAPIRLRTSGGQAGSSTQRLLESCGYSADNYFLTMEVDLASWQDPGTPTIAVAPQRADQDALRQAHNDAFRDHRNHSPIPADSWAHWATSSTLRPELSRVVREAGMILAYAVAGEYQPGVVHIDLVGTRREARGRGLAKDVLIAALRAAKDAGYRISELEVDSTSPTGADRLYRSVGYAPVRTISRYVRDLPG